MSQTLNATTVTHPLEFGDEAKIRQAVQQGTNWQDSVVLVWWDPENEIGGFHRLGHEPNSPDGGTAVLWSNITTPAGTIKRTQTKKLREEDILPGGGYGSGDGACTVEFKHGKHIWEFNDLENDIKGQIIHMDTGPNVDCFPRKGNVTKTFASAHFDIAGTVTGVLSVKGKSYQIRAGLSVRDHGWGNREWGAALLSHRWIVGTAGANFSVFAISWHSTNDQYSNFGWIVRDKVVTVAQRIDIVTYMSDESLTNRGGRIDMELVTGEKFVIDWEPVAKAYVSWHRGIACVDRLCSFHAAGDSKEFRGFGDFESTANFHAGQREPGFLIDGILKDGFTAT